MFEFDGDAVSGVSVETEQGKKFLIPSWSCSGFKPYPYAFPYTVGSGESFEYTY